ncbi:MAG TPA: hypothetical protein VEW26_13365 [Allosphingosinicella sp.]|nr:hypothetical protein [Allosphingosinicella sp.]
MRKLHALVALALLGASSAAMSQSLPLDTGFNNSNFTYYTVNGSPENYWIKVASSGTLTPTPGFNIPAHPAWQTLPGSIGGNQTKWVGPTATGTSPSGQTTFAIFRKCFCLMPGYKQAQMNFKIRGDDGIGVWLNSAGNNILQYQGGSFGGPAINGPATAPQFQTGRNCIYVLVVDTGSVVTGFNLAGTVSAFGLMPMAAAGTGASFKPCTCEGPAAASEQATIKALVKIANGIVANGGAVPVKDEGPRSR